MSDDFAEYVRLWIRVIAYHFGFLFRIILVAFAMILMAVGAALMLSSSKPMPASMPAPALEGPPGELVEPGPIERQVMDLRFRVERLEKAARGEK